MGHPAIEVKPVVGRTRARADYDAVSFVDTTGRRIKGFEDLWGVMCNDTLYLKVDRRHFVRMKEMGVFCYFTGPQYVSPEDSERAGRNAFWFGLVGGGLTAAAIDAKNRGLVHYVMNANTGVIHLLEPGYMRIVLGDLPELLAGFQAESDQAAMETLLRYLRSANRELTVRN